MSATILGLSSDFRYVLAVAVSTGFLSFWQSLKVSSARKAAGVKYPAQYAPDAGEFSQNKVEARLTFLIILQTPRETSRP